MGFTQKSSKRTYGYWLLKFESVCPWKLNIFSLPEMWRMLEDKNVHFYIVLEGKS